MTKHFDNRLIPESVGLAKRHRDYLNRRAEKLGIRSTAGAIRDLIDALLADQERKAAASPAAPRPVAIKPTPQRSPYDASENDARPGDYDDATPDGHRITPFEFFDSYLQAPWPGGEVTLQELTKVFGTYAKQYAWSHKGPKAFFDRFQSEVSSHGKAPGMEIDWSKWRFGILGNVRFR